MAFPAAPFGFKPYGGSEQKTVQCVLSASNAAIGKGDPIYETNSGCDVDRSSTDTDLRGIVGIATQAVAATTGGLLECWDVRHEAKFIAQSDVIGTTVGTNVTVARSLANIIGAGTPNSTTGRSTVSISTSTGSPDLVNAHLLVHYYAPIPGNDINTAGSYPILVVSFRDTALDAGTSKIGQGIIA
jgi:hypothetical protein